MRLQKISFAWASVVLWLFLTSHVVPPLWGQESYEQRYFVNAYLPWHPAVLDSMGRLLAWYHPEKNLGYDKFLRLDWDFLEHKVPFDVRTGVKFYLTEPMMRDTSWQHDPPSFFAHMMDMLVGWYPYSGDEEAVAVLREMLDYELAHGTTPADWTWAGVPFATSCAGHKEYGRCFQDVPAEFYGGIESDKIGELGLAYVLFYELTGERKYLSAGIQCADQLAKHVRPGDATRTPWPFRIDAHTGKVIDGEEYGGMIVAPIRLFDELLRLEEGDSPSYKRARDTVWKWLLDNPLNKESAAWDNWNGYYEDVPKDLENQNDMTSIMTCYYILSQSDPSAVDPQWRIHVGHLIDRSRVLLGRGPFFGAWAIDEQLRPDGGITGSSSRDTALLPPGGALLGAYSRGCCSGAGLSCRTSQWGAINAMFYEKTGDGSARENAFRSLNYATYFAGSDGKIACCGADYWHPYWFEDGYADAGRSFMWALGAVPDFAPKGQDHLLHSSSVVQKVKYGSSSLDYQTFDKAGIEILRLTSKPARVVAGGSVLPLRGDLKDEGYTVEALAGGDYVVHVRHTRSNKIRIEGL
jgi:hypothetical protein